MSTAAHDERVCFSDTLLDVGPEAATLCEGWNARDLAAHVVMRERRPDGAAGVLIRPLAGYTDKVQSQIAATEWTELVDTVRDGPPRWSPMRFDPLDRAANTIEFFVHHEDLRRVTEPWEPRELPGELVDDLHVALGRAVKLTARKAPAGLVLEPTDGRGTIVAKKGEPSVTVRGAVGELVMFVYGRQDHARVDLEGEPAAVEAMRNASFGV
ncbi:MAG: TIGR03085 family protein [Ilumatobacter sp.]|nr:MAG: TIGR03085 family protein [Ilumatobacter sp.]